ncbi:MAG: STAS domain-containing protein [Planctomycetes bacterium]|nr:STAS domain-containing protein [Planctomycetota bacterium]
MAQPSGHLIIQNYDRIVLVSIAKDRLLDPPVITAISTELMSLLDRHAKPSIVLDMAQVAYLSSAMVGKIIALYKGVAAAKGRMAIAGVRADLMPLFKITQIDKLIRFYPDAQQVIMEYKRKPL